MADAISYGYNKWEIPIGDRYKTLYCNYYNDFLDVTLHKDTEIVIEYAYIINMDSPRIIRRLYLHDEGRQRFGYISGRQEKLISDETYKKLMDLFAKDNVGVFEDLDQETRDDILYVGSILMKHYGRDLINIKGL